MAPLLLLLMPLLIAASSSSSCDAATSPSPSPSPSPANLTDVLSKAGYFSTFLSVASQANVSAELQAFIDANGSSGATLFVPVDAAFTTSVVATYSSLSAPQQKLLLQYHALPTFYDYSTLLSRSSQSLSNLSTFAPGLSLDVTVHTGTITVHASLNSANVTSNYATTFPLTVFAIDAVLLPPLLPSPPPVASSPAPTTPTPTPTPTTPTPTTPTTTPAQTPASSASSKISPAPAPASSAPPPPMAAAAASSALLFSILLVLLHSTYITN